MIDKEYEIYSRLCDYLALHFANIATSSTYENAPSKFPFVSIEQIDNTNNQRASDNCNLENAVDVAFEINIYTKDTDKKVKAKEISSYVDDFMINLGFDRTSCVPAPVNDGVSYRLNMRYNGVIGKDCIVYRR